MLSSFSRDVLDEICDLIESVSEGFPSNSFRIVKYQSIVINIINLLGALYLISI